MTKVEQMLIRAEAAYLYRKYKNQGDIWWQKRKQEIVLNRGQAHLDNLTATMTELRKEERNANV